jgi:hypothetical protein
LGDCLLPLPVVNEALHDSSLQAGHPGTPIFVAV